MVKLLTTKTEAELPQIKAGERKRDLYNKVYQIEWDRQEHLEDFRLLDKKQNIQKEVEQITRLLD